jgi:hypothetical protein
MDITKKLNVSAEAFFNTLVDSIAYDVKHSIGRAVGYESMKDGFSYKKQMANRFGQQGDVTISVTELVKPTIYAASFEAKTGTNFVKYEIEEIGENKISVHYVESFHSDKLLNRLNYTLMSLIYYFGSKKRIVNMLTSIEQSILGSE